MTYFVSNDILLDEKESGNILVCSISCKTLIGSKHLRMWFDKIDGLIRINDGTRYLVLFVGEKLTSSSTRLDIL